MLSQGMNLNLELGLGLWLMLSQGMNINLELGLVEQLLIVSLNIYKSSDGGCPDSGILLVHSH
jgi:hypothetical protein